MRDIRIEKMAHILIDYSTNVQPGDRVGIVATVLAEPLVRALYELTLDRGGLPHLLLDFVGQDESFYAHAREEHLDFVPLFHKMAFEQFEVLIKVRSDANTRALSNVDSQRQSRRQKGLASLLEAQLRRGAEGSLRWMSTLYPTAAYAMEAEMGLQEYQDFFFRACHADENTSDPVAYWRGVQRKQEGIIRWLEGHDHVQIQGPHAGLSLSIRGRKFRNASGQNNLPDGEIYTAPIESSVNGWVRFTYPAVFLGRVVEGVELTFEQGRVVRASAEKNQDFLLKMLEVDEGAHYVGEFAIGTNFEINRFTHNILLDEKIGGSFHLALGAGYPETGSLNKSVIHWDMICDLRQDSQILVDGEMVYQNGEFAI